MRNLFRAGSGDFVEPINNLGIAATILNQAIKAIAAGTLALGTGYAQHIELAD
ncbi:MAG TPA: hypothetical protein VI358_19530 [Pseudolabrys sp.]